MPEKGAGSQTLTIRSEEIPVEVRLMDHVNLKFYPENPRVYSLLAVDGGDPSQDEIEKALGEMEHVKLLLQSIKANGGLIDPLIVKSGSNIVLEGNSRLAAYRLLCKGDRIKWAKAKCMLLPEDISEELVFALLGEYHIIGRKDWAPFEQAGYLWRRHKKHKISAEKMHMETGLSAKSIRHLVHVYDFMKEKKELDPQRWSYYHEYLKSIKIGKARDYRPDLDDIVVAKIRSGEILRADDLRDKLPAICDPQRNKKILNRFLDGRSLDECYEEVEKGGANNVIYLRLNKFREMIASPDVKIAVGKMPTEIRKKCKYELDKINKSVAGLLGKLQ